MQPLDLLVPLLMLLTPLIQYYHGNRLLSKGRSVTHLTTVSAFYNLAPLLIFFYVLASDLPDRMMDATGLIGTSLLVIWGPMWLSGWFHLYVSYLLDRRARQADWPFSEFVKAGGRFHVLLTAFILPLLVALPLLEYLIPDPEDWVAALALGLLVAAGLFLTWLGWRWTAIRNQPVEPTLLERLTALTQQLGFTPHAIEILPLKGGKVANAFLSGWRHHRLKILLTDYLVESFTPQQVEMIVAHEIGHARLGHLKKRLWLTAVYVPVTTALAVGWILLAITRWDLPMLVAILPAMAIAILPSQLILLPILRRQEFDADRWAAEATGRGSELAEALERLEQLNQVDIARLPRWLRAIFGHPLTAQRAAALRAYTE